MWTGSLDQNCRGKAAKGMPIGWVMRVDLIGARPEIACEPATF